MARLRSFIIALGGGGRGVIVPFYSVQDCSFLLMNCWDRDDFGETPRQWRRKVSVLQFLIAEVVFYRVLIVYIILSNQAFTGNIVEKPVLHNSEQATSQVCFIVWRAGLLTVTRRIPILIGQSKYFKTLRTKRKLLRQMIVPRMS